MCEKLQAAIINPSTVNPLVHEMNDFGLNPSLSSDDTLATNEGEEPSSIRSNGEQATNAICDSTEDESEEGPTSILN